MMFQDSAAGGAAATMSEEYYVILCGKMYSQLLKKGYTSTRAAFNALDSDGDNKISRQEFEDYMRKLGVGGSADERTLIFEKIDADKNAFITADEFEQAIKQGSQFQGIERWVQEITKRVGSAIKDSGRTTTEVFMKLAQDGGSAPGAPVQQLMFRDQFERLLSAFDESLSPSQLQRLWQMADKNNDGSLDLAEFNRMFESREGVQSGITGLSAADSLAAQRTASQVSDVALAKKLEQQAKMLVEPAPVPAKRSCPDLSDVERAQIVLRRLAQNLVADTAEKTGAGVQQQVQNTFGSYAMGVTQNGPGLQFPDWNHIFAHVRKPVLGLSAEEAKMVFQSCSEGGPMAPVAVVSGKLTEALGAAPGQLEAWVKNWMNAFNGEAQKQVEDSRFCAEEDGAPSLFTE